MDIQKLVTAERCEFLREAQVKWCRAAPFRKEIVRHSGSQVRERCSSTAWATCPTARVIHEECPSLTRCPFLQETLAQYCSAAGISKFIPYNEVSPSRCNTGSHSYCQVFLSSTDAHFAKQTAAIRSHNLPEGANLFFSPNHMWMRIHEDGSCHIGVDAFFAEVLGTVENLSFLTSSSFCFPTATITVHRTKLAIVFPLRIRQTCTNASLVSDPGAMIRDPYSRGWLFEGRNEILSNGVIRSPLERGFMSQESAERWINVERACFERYIRDELVSMDANKTLTMMDGGTLREGWFSLLSKRKLTRLYYKFFSPASFLPSAASVFNP